MKNRILTIGRRCALGGGAALALALAFSASAAAAPTGEYANFGKCPVTNPNTTACLFAQSLSGEFKIGSTTVPLTKTLTLQGGLTASNSEGFSEVLAATNGETLSKTPQTVPGGLFKIIAPKFLPGFLQELFNEFINKGFTGVTATTELAGTPRVNIINAFTGAGTALELPTRVHLENSFLGGGCYVGSSAHPVVVDLITGTTSPPAPNKPITGSVGEVEARDEGNLIVIKKNSLVNNSFAAPAAEGCGGFFSFLIDPAVDAELELPSAAGHNTAILNGNQEIGLVGAVKASE